MMSSFYEEAEQRVQALLTDYAHYQKVEQKRSDLAGEQVRMATQIAIGQGFVRKISTAEVLTHADDYPSLRHLKEQINQQQQELQRISDAMTFDNPLVWIMYKHKAYQGTPHALLTLQDLRAHCDKKGYICTKRFTFINDRLAQRGFQTLLDNHPWGPTDTLDTIYTRPEYQALSEDPLILKEWQTYEYYHEGERVAKWENYVQ